MESLPKKNKKIPKSINEMSKEMLQETLKKKRECNAKAQETVLKLCESLIDEEWFLDNLQFINQCHFEDVIIERAIIKMCGYPMCDQQLKNIPHQKYHISTKYNKVFDITERKNFCSGYCYKSAMHVKEQLFTSPLWFRDQEKIPKYTLLKPKNSLIKDENKVEVENVKLEQDKKEKDNFEKLVTVAEEKCSQLSINDERVENKPEEVVRVDNENSDIANKGFHISKNIETLTNTENSQVENIHNEQNSFCNENSELNIVKDAVKKSKEGFVCKNTVGNKTSYNSEEKIKQKPLKLMQNIEKCILEWFSLETLFYLYGEQKLKELFQDKAPEIKKVLNLKLSTAFPSKKIEKMLCLYELLDADLERCNEVNTNLKPLPDYSILKEEGKTLEIKVRAFYQGQLEVKQPNKKEIELEHEAEPEAEPDSNPSYLPLIDSHTQMAFRRKIVLDKLNRVLYDLIQVFSSDFVLQMSDVRNLISTFKLSAHNITFKPAEWVLVGLIITKLLSIKDKDLASLLNLETSTSQIKFILSNYSLKEDYLDDFILKVTDYSYLIEKFNEINE